MAKLILGFIKKAAKVLQGGKEHEEQNPFLKAIRDIPTYIGGKIIKNPFEMILKGYKNTVAQIEKGAKNLQDAVDNKVKEMAQKRIGQYKRIMKVIKLIAKIIKIIIKLIAKLISILPPLGIVIVIIIVIVAVILILASLFNLFSFSYGFDKTAYYDNNLYQAVKNKELMQENLYERAGETSYYQRFVDAELENLTGLMLPEYLLGTDNYNSSKNYKREIEEAQKKFTGFYSLDSRLTIHDANFNNMSAFIQANTIDSNLDNSLAMQGFLRDYFNKEVNFELSSHFLMQLNNKAFAKNGMYKEMQLIYPEIFTKPVSYVYDFNRVELIENLVNDKFEYEWKDYTYITQRITKNDVGKKLSDILVNFNELTWGKYYGASVNPDYIIQQSDEGKIFSWASPVVWEYIVKSKDDYRRFLDKKTSAMVTNDYNSEYLLFKNDETGEELIPKFYYLITGKTNGSFSKSGSVDGTFGEDQSDYTFSEPYIALKDKLVTDVNTSNIFDNKVTIVNSDGTPDSNGKWYKINIPEGYRLITDISPKTQNEDGTFVNQARTIDYVLVSKDFNAAPKKHIQLANLIGENGDVVVSSQNLINYKYFKFKTVSEAYRNKQEYVDGWATYIDKEGKFFTAYSDRSFWGAVTNRVSGAFGNLANSIFRIENNLEKIGDNQDDEGKKMFNVVAKLPKDAINFSLYLYEKDFVSNTIEDNETWKYDYSVNNYFKTDNDRLDSLESFQKYFYIAEELIIARNEDGTWKTDSATFKYLKRMYYEFNYLNNGKDELSEDEYFSEITNSTGGGYHIVISNYQRFIDYLNSLYSRIVVQVDMNGIKGEDKRYLEMISNSMSTRYMNLGTVRKEFSITAFKDIIVGETIYGVERKGEVSLQSTLKSDDYLRKEMISFSALNGSSEDNIGYYEHDFTYLNSYENFVTNVQNWFSTKFLGIKTKEDETPEIITVRVSKEEHSHLQTDYYIRENNLNTYSSNVFEYTTDTSKTESELPLELKSVRDYGLGSILNYVDSVVVEFQSGVTYDETYLKQKIGEEILSEYEEVYNTYSIKTKNNEENAINTVGEGYYPKEVKDYGGDFLIELFAQNNKKKFFKDLINTLDGKILEISNEYDIACSDPEADRKIKSLDKAVDNDSEINNINNFKFTVGLEGQNTTNEINIELDGDGKVKITASNSSELNDIEELFKNNQIYEIFDSKSGSTGITSFNYYTPYLKTGATRLSQLLLPKRYYRSWLDISTREEDYNKFDRFILGSDIVTKEEIPLKEEKIREALDGKDGNFSSAYDLAVKNDIIETKWYTSSKFEQGNYVQYLLDKTYNSKNFIEGLSGDYEFITDGDIKKVYLIDEVVTFAGKFMYTYKDTLLTITPSSDETMPKSVIGAYATDRYVFLDSWDIKLLTDRVAEVDFMIFDVKGMMKYKGEWISIPDYIKKKSEDNWGYASRLINKYKRTELSDTTKSSFVMIVPPKYKDTIDDKCQYLMKYGLNDSGTEAWAENLIKELEAYTIYISEGFLFAEGGNSIYSNLNGANYAGDYISKYDIVTGKTVWSVNQEVIDTAVNNLRNELKKEIDTSEFFSENSLGGQVSQEISSDLQAVVDYYNSQTNEGFDNSEYIEADNLYRAVLNNIDNAYNDGTFSSFNEASDWENWFYEEIYNDEYSDWGYNFHIGLINNGALDNLIDNIEDFYNENELYQSLLDENGDLKKSEATYAIYLEVINAQKSALYYILYNVYSVPKTYNYSSNISLDDLEEGGWFEQLKRWIEEKVESILSGVSFVINGFRITTVKELSALQIEDTIFNKFLTNVNISGEHAISVLQQFFNKYVRVLDKKVIYNDYQIDDFDRLDYIDLKYELSMGVTANNFNKNNNADEICRLFIKKVVCRYTLKLSDEIAMSVDSGRYYSQLSSVGAVGVTGTTSIINEKVEGFINPTGDEKFGYGELLYVAANKTAIGENQVDTNTSKSNIYISSEEFYNMYKDLCESKGITCDINSIEEWQEIWSPQLKVFDSINNEYYKKTSMKEYLYGIYLNEKNIIPDNGNVYATTKTLDNGKTVKLLNTNEGKIKVSEYTNQTKKKFLIFFKTENTKNDYGFLDGLLGVNYNRSSGNGEATILADNYLKGFKLQRKIKHPLFWPDESLGRTEDNNFSDKTETINLTDTSELIIPVSKLDLNTFTEVLNYFYRDEAIEIVKQGSFSLELIEKNKDLFDISGFVLVPRLADRRDEPTIYPLYKYWGGAKKKIEPTEVLKYFEGQTYNSWKNKMTINESSTNEEINWFHKEKDRLSEYLRAYLENFEAYVPYNIISDSDLEIRGTAGYGDLMTNYTLTPNHTAKYSHLFLNEANKAYWSDFIKRYDITPKDLAQLLQGLAEKSLETAAEDSLNTLRVGTMAYKNAGTSSKDLASIREARHLIGAPDELNTSVPKNSNENVALIQDAIMETINGAKPTVTLETEDGNYKEYYLPIVGLAAIDDSREYTIEDEIKETLKTEGISNFKDFTFIGNFSDSFKSDVLSDAGDISSSIHFYMGEDYSVSTAQTIINNNKDKEVDRKGFIIMLGANDVLKETGTSVKTDKYRNLIYSLFSKNPNAEIYVIKYPGFANYDNYEDVDNVVSNVISFKNGLGVSKLSPKEYNASSIYKDYTRLNIVMDNYNKVMETTLNNLNNSKIHILDFSDIYGNGTYGISDNYIKNDIYFNDYSLYDLIKEDIFGNSFNKEIPTIQNNVKTTRNLRPSGELLDAYEVDLLITKSSVGNVDSRLDRQKSVAFMSMRLYKLSTSFNDLLKGVYAYYYGTDFVNSLINVTADNAYNLVEDAEHGLWYNPTANDIKRAFDNKLPIEDTDRLVEVFGVQKLKDTFSYVTNIESRKKLVVGAMNSRVTSVGQLPGIPGVSNKGAKEFTMILNKGEDKEFVYKENYHYSIQPDGTFGPGVNNKKATSSDASNTKVNLKDVRFDTTMKTHTVAIENGRNKFTKSSKQYAIVNKAEVDDNTGILYIEEDGVKYLCVALGKAFGDVGSKFIVTTDKGNSWYAIKTDEKSEQHTDAFNQVTIVAYTKDLHPELDVPRNDNHTMLRKIETDGKDDFIYTCANEFEISDVHYKKALAEGKISSSWNKTKGFEGNVISIVPVDKAGGASNSRDYTEELWEAEYLKYQNTGLIEYVNHMHGSDIENLISSTANYRNNNQVQHEEGYTYLDFFKNIEKVDSTGENKFTGKQTDSLLLNAMTYLGAHYSQGRAEDVTKKGTVISRFANMDNITASKKNSLPYFGFSTWPYGNTGIYYQEGANYFSKIEGMYGMDCSSFGSMAYIAMGYEFINSTCEGLRSGFINYPGNDVTREVNYNINNLKPGDLIISTSHTVIWMGDYAVNFGNLFNENTLKIKDSSLYNHTGPEVLAYANSLAGKKVYIHQGGYKKGKSCVNISEAYSSILTKNNAKVYRIFFDDIEYTEAAMQENQIIKPKIFTSTTIKNNPYLVEYMESAGILQEKLNTGLFTSEDVLNAKKVIAEINGGAYMNDLGEVSTN